MKIKSLAKGLKYKGDAEGKRQTYHVFEGSDFFFLISFKKNNPSSGNFNVVELEAIQSVLKKFHGKSRLTSQDILNGLSKTKTRYFNSRFDALNALYVLVGLKQAKVDTRFKSTSLYFNIKETQ